jgi:cell division protein FtsW (lipid II flippase)
MGAGVRETLLSYTGTPIRDSYTGLLYGTPRILERENKMLNDFHSSYLTWLVITVLLMTGFYGQNDNESWERMLAYLLTIVMLLAVPRKHEDTKKENK